MGLVAKKKPGAGCKTIFLERNENRNLKKPVWEILTWNGRFLDMFVSFSTLGLTQWVSVVLM